MKVVVVGAGIAGLAATKVLTRDGHDVTTFEERPDLGGVWSATRAYPGLGTQNTRRAYTYSDHPMPEDWPEHPDAALMHDYLESSVDRFGFRHRLRLGTRVCAAVPRPGGGWTVEAAGDLVECDHLVAANGVFCTPFVPPWPGRAAHGAGGGAVTAPSEHLTLEDARGRHVVVVGYGKSACDTAVALSEVARSVTVVARRLLWKGSKRSLGRDYEDIVLTRLAESAFRHPRRARLLFDAVRAATIRSQRLDELGLVPPGRFEEIARSSISLLTDGFTDAVADGSIRVRPGRSIVELGADGTGPTATLDDGAVLPADLVVAATGFTQEVPFLPADVQDRILDPHGDFVLYRQILPHDVADLTFCGYNSSVISALNAEVGATWIAAHLAGRLSLLDVGRRRAVTGERLRTMRARTGGHHAHGTSTVPFSLENIDVMLHDLGTPLPWRTRLGQWHRSAVPGDYRAVLAPPARAPAEATRPAASGGRARTG